MTTIAQKLSNQHDELFLMHGGTLRIRKDTEPRCGYPAIMAYVKKNKRTIAIDSRTDEAN